MAIAGARTSAKMFGSFASLIVFAWTGLVSAEPVVVQKGTLFLDLSGPTEFRWENPVGNTVDQQVISERRCEVRWADDPLPLIDIATAAGVAPGFVDYLGVYGGGNGNSGRGTPCGQVQPGQDLTFTLGANFEFQYRVIDSEIDLQLKGSPEVTIVTSLEGDPTGTYLIRGGDAINPLVGRAAETAETIAAPIPNDEDPLAAPVVINCLNLSDAGPDSGDRDNCRVKFLAPWDAMSVTTTGGDVSIGGGGDSGFTKASEFVLVQEFDGELDCDESTITAINSQTGAFGTLRRLDNVPEGECTAVCNAIPYTLDWLGNELQFFADYLEGSENPQSCAAFAFTVNFEPLDILTTGGAGDIVRPSDDPNTSPADERAVVVPDFGRTVTSQIPLAIVQQFVTTDPEYYLDTCLGTPQYATSDNLPAYVAGDLVELDFGGTSPPDMSSLIGTQYGCWLNIRLRYGVDPTPEPPNVGGPGTPDELRFEVDGYVQGDWRLRY